MTPHGLRLWREWRDAHPDAGRGAAFEAGYNARLATEGEPTAPEPAEPTRDRWNEAHALGFREGYQRAVAVLGADGPGLRERVADLLAIEDGADARWVAGPFLMEHMFEYQKQRRAATDALRAALRAAPTQPTGPEIDVERLAQAMDVVYARRYGPVDHPDYWRQYLEEGTAIAAEYARLAGDTAR